MAVESTIIPDGAADDTMAMPTALAVFASAASVAGAVMAVGTATGVAAVATDDAAGGMVTVGADDTVANTSSATNREQT